MNLEAERHHGGLPGERVPAGVVADAKAIFARRGTGELASLVFDSVVDEGAPAADHRLRFEHRLIAIDLHVSADYAASNLEGSIYPRGPVQVRLQSEADDLSIGQDALEGGFVFSGIAHGLVRLHLSGDAIPDVRTDWFRI